MRPVRDKINKLTGSTWTRKLSVPNGTQFSLLSFFSGPESAIGALQTKYKLVRKETDIRRLLS